MMNAQIRTYSDALADKVTGFSVGTSMRIKDRVKPVRGYALSSQTRTLALIETTESMPRIEELLSFYSLHGRPRTARELMRSLLNHEDYRSRIYDVIVRVHYEEDFYRV